jgi:SAM-dependent methyltransferase
VYAPPLVHEIFQSADLMVNGGGVTSLELGLLQVPQVLMSLASNQKKTCQFLANHDFVDYLGPCSDLTDAELEKRLLRALNDFSAAVKKAKKLSDFLVQKFESSNGISTFFHNIYAAHFKDDYTFEEVEKEYSYEVAPSDAHVAAKWSSHASMVNRFKLGDRVISWAHVCRWLDVGSGTGDFLAEVEKTRSIDEFVGIDLSSSMNEMAAARSYKTSKAGFFKQNLLDFSPEKPFDLITAIGVLQKCGISPFLFFNKVYSLLADDGEFFFTTKNLGWEKFATRELTPFHGHKWFYPDDLSRVLETCGFEVRRCGGFLPSDNLETDLKDSHTMYFDVKKKSL